MEITVLDCTLRDGGYYNSWDFKKEDVTKYLNVMSRSGIDYVELGFRESGGDGYFGPYFYSSDTFLCTLELPENLSYCVMVNAKTVINGEGSISETLSQLFSKASESPVTMVRVAAHYHEIEHCKEITKWLKSSGYKIGLNLMQTGGKSSEVVATTVSEIDSWSTVDVLYFADSLGNMMSDEVERHCKTIRSVWKGDIGFHAHDNLRKGLENTITAQKSGARWLDATVTGMGRGAGNVQTELLLTRLKSDFHIADLELSDLYELVLSTFEPMQRKFGWGSNLLYYLGAQNNIHPTYIQKMISDRRYGPVEQSSAIKYLASDNAAMYDGLKFESALNIVTDKNHIRQISVEPSDVTGMISHEVLLIGGGDSVSEHIDNIKIFINKHHPVVVAVNINPIINEKIVDYYIVSHNVKYLSEKEQYQKISKPIVLPGNRFSDDEWIDVNSKKINFPLEVLEEKFEVNKSGCIIPSDLTSVYALGFLAAAGARVVKLVGFDGYEANDIRERQMIEALKLAELSSKLDISSLTKTTYPVRQSDLFRYI